MKIKLQDLTPEIYYNRSRDFQFLGRLFDVVLNSVKTNADMIYNAPLSDNSDPAWIDLMTMTLGFQSKHNYNVKQLTALCNTFATIMKYKGSLKAIQLAGDALSNAEGLTEKFDCYLDENDQYNLIMTLPVGLDDTSLLRDLMNYVLPAGMTYKFIPNIASGTDAALTSGFNVSITDYANKTDEQLSIVIPNVDTYGQLTKQPKDWTTKYTDYYTREWNTEQNKYIYTKVSESSAPTWEANKYYQYENVKLDTPKDTTGFTVNSSIIVPQLTKSKGEK